MYLYGGAMPTGVTHVLCHGLAISPSSSVRRSHITGRWGSGGNITRRDMTECRLVERTVNVYCARSTGSRNSPSILHSTTQYHTLGIHKFYACVVRRMTLIGFRHVQTIRKVRLWLLDMTDRWWQSGGCEGPHPLEGIVSVDALGTDVSFDTSRASRTMMVTRQLGQAARLARRNFRGPSCQLTSRWAGHQQYTYQNELIHIRMSLGRIGSH
jgi:hypothetical protein